MAKTKKIGLVLSGGASRLFAQVGVLKELYRKDFEPEAIAGCSAGAIIGMCLAAGKSVEQIEDFVLKQNPFTLLDIKMNKSGLIQGEKIVKHVLNFAGVKTFEDLKIPLRVNATNINTGEEMIFTKGDLLPAINASICFPGVFAPKKLGDHLYSDGGITSPLPMHLVKDCKCVVAVDASFFHKKVTDRSSAAQIVAQAVYHMQRKLVEQEVNNVKKDKDLLLFTPLVEEYNLFEYRKQKYLEMIYAGVKEAKKIFATPEGKKFIKFFKTIEDKRIKGSSKKK